MNRDQYYIFCYNTRTSSAVYKTRFLFIAKAVIFVFGNFLNIRCLDYGRPGMHETR